MIVQILLRTCVIIFSELAVYCWVEDGVGKEVPFSESENVYLT